MLNSFKNKDIKSELEYSYRFETKITKKFSLSDCYGVVRVSRPLLENIKNCNNYELLVNRIDNSWHTREDFLNRSIAHIALHKDNIVGVCFGSALYNGYITVDIETNKDHRRLGIAASLVKYFVNTAINSNYIVQWDRIESNVASKLLAGKCGFKLFKVRPYYWFKI